MTERKAGEHLRDKRSVCAYVRIKLLSHQQRIVAYTNRGLNRVALVYVCHKQAFQDREDLSRLESYVHAREGKLMNN